MTSTRYKSKSQVHRATKRAMDLIGAALGVLVCWPILIIAGLGVAISSGFPVLFRQVRVGRGGRKFVIIKFRTMCDSNGAEHGRFDAGDISQVTSFGRFLRKTKIDELPQIWNVFRGDMSLVGPRPEVPEWVEAYPEDWSYVLQIRPGITDPASIEFRDEEVILANSENPEGTYRTAILPRKLNYYRYYVTNRTLAGDIKISLRTLHAVTLGTLIRRTQR